MKIDHREEGKNIIVTLHGSLRLDNIKEIEEKLQVFFSGKPETVGIDFKEVEYLDSSAIAVLVRLMKGTIGTATKLVLFDLQPEVMKIFELTKLHRFFTIITRDQFQKKYHL